MWRRPKGKWTRIKHYVSHAYQHKGPHRVQLTTTWNATFTVAGINIPLAPITNTYGPVPVDVRTGRSQLVAND